MQIRSSKDACDCSPSQALEVVRHGWRSVPPEHDTPGRGVAASQMTDE